MTKKSNSKKEVPQVKDSKKKPTIQKKEETKETKSLLGVPLPQTPVVEPPIEPVVEAKPFDLSRKSSLAPHSVGLPKSKKPWKVLSQRSAKHTKINPKTW